MIWNCYGIGALEGLTGFPLNDGLTTIRPLWSPLGWLEGLIGRAI